MIRRFHEFFESRFWRVFAILPNCAPPRAIQSSCIHTPYELAGRHRAQGVLLVCFAAGTAAGASVASASIEGIVENVVQVQCTVRFMQYVLKPSLKIGSVNKAFLF